MCISAWHVVCALLMVAIIAVILQSSQEGKGTLVGIRTMGFVIVLAGAGGGRLTLVWSQLYCQTISVLARICHSSGSAHTNQGLGGLAVKDCATLTNPWRESVSDSHAWHCRARCIESFVGARGALKASKSPLLIHLKQEFSPVFYTGE